MIRVILRVDDVCGGTDASDLETVLAPCWGRGIPVCLSVIPASAYRFGPEGVIPATVAALETNGRLRQLVGDRSAAGLAEIALHGWQHHHGELVYGSAEEIRRRLESGLQVLCDAWPDSAIRVLVPPHDYLSGVGLDEASRLGLGVCSTWASLHGGTRLAHWVGRLRRKAGWSTGSCGPECWFTDIAVTDFAGRAEDDWPLTRRLLAHARRWQTTVVFVLHTWRLIEDQRYSRWTRWLDQVAAQPDVQFLRFGDDR